MAQVTPTSAGKRAILVPDVTMIPAELRDQKAWVNWRAEWDGKRWTKVPINSRTGGLASNKDPSTWSDLPTALRRMGFGCDGIGLCRSDDLIFIDLDGCFDADGNLRPFPWAQKILDAVSGRAYVEKSVSGTGAHATCRGKLPPGGRKFDLPDQDHVGYEFSDSNRYFTFTGAVLPQSGPICDLTEELTALHRELFQPKPKLNGSNGKVNSSTQASNRSGLSDSEILDRAERATNGDKFARLRAGDWSDYSSQSEADMAFCCMLAFWVGNDPSRIDALFRQSGLYREKWEREDYRNNTITKAIQQTTETFDPGRRRQREGRATKVPQANDVVIEETGVPENHSDTDEEPRREQSAQKPEAKRTTPDSSAFRLTDDAVVYTDRDGPDKEPVRICGRLEVTALTRDGRGDAWGCLLRWYDPEGRQHDWAMPYSLLAGEGNEYRARLMDEGLWIKPGRKARELLTTYLQTARPEKLALCVARIGWHGDSFVLPGATIGPEGAEPVLFQTAFEAEHYFNIHGSVEDWRDNVGRLCSGNSRLILAASCAFAGPLLFLAGGESGGVHLVGPTSTGKSTALVVGGSVLGGGGQNGFVRTWRATGNGLEAIAELHNHACLFLDELAQVDAREAAETAYLLGNGTGKVRMNRHIGARKMHSWSLPFVSAGEITLADHAQTAGKRVKGGAEVRLLNIDADAGAGLGLFENLHGAESAEAFARQLKVAARRFYGAPIRTYLEYLVRNRAAVEDAIPNFQADFLGRHVPAGASGEVFRAAQRFALIAAAGEIATSAGITGWAQGEAIPAAARCLKSWIAGRGTAGAADTQSAIRQVKNFIEVNGSSRFQPAKPRLSSKSELISDRVINRAGFRLDNENGDALEYLILEEVFRSEVCRGFDHQFVARTLRDKGYLNPQPPHLTKKRPLPEVGDIRVYSVSPSILEA